MKLLNNNGWSLNTMIVLIVILFLVVLIVSILMYNFGIEKDSPNLIFDNMIVIE